MNPACVGEAIVLGVVPGVSVKLTEPYPRSAARVELPSVTEAMWFAVPVDFAVSASSVWVESTWRTEAETPTFGVPLTAVAIAAITWSFVCPSVSVTVTCVPFIEKVLAPAPSDVMIDVSDAVSWVDRSISDFASRVTLSSVCVPIAAALVAVPFATPGEELATEKSAKGDDDPTF